MTCYGRDGATAKNRRRRERRKRAAQRRKGIDPTRFDESIPAWWLTVFDRPTSSEILDIEMRASPRRLHLSEHPIDPE